jgi:hypothetical protein
MRSIRSLLALVGAAFLLNAAHADVTYNWDFNTAWSGTDGDKSGYGTGWGARSIGGSLPNGSLIGTGTMTWADGGVYGRTGGGVAVITSTEASKGVAFNLKLKDASSTDNSKAFRDSFEQSVNKQYNPYVQVEIWGGGGFGLYTNGVDSIASGKRTNSQREIEARSFASIQGWNPSGWNTYRIELDSLGVVHGYVNNQSVGTGGSALTLADAFSASMGLFVYPGATTMVVDNFQFGVTPVPEPETYAMLLAGLGLIGAAVKRSKAKQA